MPQAWRDGRTIWRPAPDTLPAPPARGRLALGREAAVSPQARWTVQPPCDVGRVAPVETHAPCLYCHVKPCKEIYPTDTDRWCGYCSGATSGLLKLDPTG
jgi:hypothetical protein